MGLIVLVANTELMHGCGRPTDSVVAFSFVVAHRVVVLVGIMFATRCPDEVVLSVVACVVYTRLIR